MLKHEDNAVARINGNNLQPLAGVSVTVTDKVTGLPAYLYADDGVTPLAQPLITNDNGYYGFKAPDGTYLVTFSGQRIEAFTREITLDDPKDNPYVTVAGLAAGTGAQGVGYNGRTLADKLDEFVSVKDFGAKGDGVTDDTAAIQAAINHGGRVRLIDNATHKITAALSLNLAFASLIGCGSVIDAATSPNGALLAFSSATYGAQRLERNWTHWVEGVAFEGNKTAGYDLVTVGHATYLNNSEITFRNCGFRNAARLVRFIDNAWRCNFDHCGFESGIANYLHFNSGANAGEVMRFSHCWFVDGTNCYFYLKEGQWYFDKCSFPGGGTGGMQVLGAAHVVLHGCNLEAQPAAANQRMIEGYNSSMIVLDACTLSNSSGLADRAMIAVTDACALRVQNCTLPLYGADLRSEIVDGARELVSGDSKHVAFRDNYVKGTGATDRTQWAVLSRLGNLLGNGSAESGSSAPWTVSTYGTAGSTFTSETIAPKTGARHFRVTCVANGGLIAKQTMTGAQVLAGRTAVFGMWTKANGGTGAVDYPTLRFLDASGAELSNMSVAVNATDTAYTWLGGGAVVPYGTATISFEVGGQQQAGVHSIDYDAITLNVI